MSLCAIQRQLLAVFFLLILLLFSSVGFADPLRVGVPTLGQVPFFWQDKEGEYQGIYPDTLRLVAADLNRSLIFVPLSQARLRRHFEMSEIDIEMGVTDKVEDEATLRKVSLFTRPFSVVNEVIIYRPELSFPVFILKDLAGQHVATVRGNTVPDNLIREDFTNEWQIAQRVHRGWNNIGLMKEAVALHYQRKHNLNYETSLPYASNPVSFRVNIKEKEIVTSMNLSILRLEKEGVLEQLVCKYLCGPTILSE